MNFLTISLIALAVLIISVVGIFFWASLSLYLKRRDSDNRQFGCNHVLSHIYSRIKEQGSIILRLDGKNMTVGEIKK